MREIESYQRKKSTLKLKIEWERGLEWEKGVWGGEELEGIREIEKNEGKNHVEICIENTNLDGSRGVEI